ncbi:hypothetical protein FRC11_011837, partial [Ceratobasidium sp. 423]
MQLDIPDDADIVSNHGDSTVDPVGEPHGNYTAHPHEAVAFYRDGFEVVAFYRDGFEVPPPDQESLLRNIEREAASYQAALA